MAAGTIFDLCCTVKPDDAAKGKSSGALASTESCVCQDTQVLRHNSPPPNHFMNYAHTQRPWMSPAVLNTLQIIRQEKCHLVAFRLKRKNNQGETQFALSSLQMGNRDQD